MSARWLRLRRRSSVGSVSCSGPPPPTPLPIPDPESASVGRAIAQHDGQRPAPVRRSVRRPARPSGSRYRSHRPSRGTARGSSGRSGSGRRRPGCRDSRARGRRTARCRCRCPGRQPVRRRRLPVARCPRPAGPGRSTSRSVSTKITPITDTKMILTPASASIGAAWVCMWSSPAATGRRSARTRARPRPGANDDTTKSSTASRASWPRRRNRRRVAPGAGATSSRPAPARSATRTDRGRSCRWSAVAR